MDLIPGLTRLQQLQEQMLRDALVDAQTYYVDSERFKEALRLGITMLGLTDSDLAHCVGVSTSTVSRWRRGVSLPYGKARLPILKMMLEKCDAKDGGP